MFLMPIDLGKPEFEELRIWIGNQRNAGIPWAQIKTFGVTDTYAESMFLEYRDCKGIIPAEVSFADWPVIVENIKKEHLGFEVSGGLQLSMRAGEKPAAVAPKRGAWRNYKKTLRDKMAEDDVNNIADSSDGIIEKLKNDTQGSEAVKGLVIGGVQSGKTANMLGVVTKAADLDFNIFIVLTGMITNLREQTEERFRHELDAAGVYTWHFLKAEKGGKLSETVGDSVREFYPDSLLLNAFRDGKPAGNNTDRYVFACLKNTVWLRKLLAALRKASPTTLQKMRIVVLDDEADQASINTKKMDPDDSEEEAERTVINRRIMELVNGYRNSASVKTRLEYGAMNYLCYTATPYANVLNEAPGESLYPKDFIHLLPESRYYFGIKQIFGSHDDPEYPGMNIIRAVSADDMRFLEELHDGSSGDLEIPESLKQAVAWFLCSAALLRCKKWKKPITMLIHTTPSTDGHYEVYDKLNEYFQDLINVPEKKIMFLNFCRFYYKDEYSKFEKKELAESVPYYAGLDGVDDEFPPFETIRPELEKILTSVRSIRKSGDEYYYHDNVIHLCVDNSKAAGRADKGTSLRIHYPTAENLAMMEKAPVFIVLGGNTLSRGLTLEGLSCTYFARDVHQVDTLMQMARWFGYRKGYELLQRIWMPSSTVRKFCLMQEINEKLRFEIEDFVLKGKTPEQVGPRIMNSSEVSRFKLTSSNKMQNSALCDYSGDSYEITRFDNDASVLKGNIELVDQFLGNLGTMQKSEFADCAYVVRDVDSEYILGSMLEKFAISDACTCKQDIPVFIEWMRSENRQGRYLKWNVAIAGKEKTDNRWRVAGADVGKVERSKKKGKSYLDIGSLRSGYDVLCDVDPELLDQQSRERINDRRSRPRQLVSFRSLAGLADTPLLLFYMVDKDSGHKSEIKEKLDSSEDIVSFSVIIPGGTEEKNGTDYLSNRM